jgi:hypothetical protein
LTVIWYSGSVSKGCAGSLRGVLGLSGDCDIVFLLEQNKPVETGVTDPEHPKGLVRGFNTSDAARSKRFVVPRVFVNPERAEHTIAT